MYFTLRRSARAKKMTLRLNESGDLTLVLPRFVPEIAGRAFVSANKKWIERHRSMIDLPVYQYGDKTFRSGDNLIFFDQNIYSLKIEKTSQKKSSYQLDGQTLCLLVSPLESQKQLRKLIEKFYRDQARAYLTSRSEYFAFQLGKTFNQLRIKNTKSRWGSCSSQKNLNFNWRIMMAPKVVIDYLVVHEVCHLAQMNHSSKFWNLVARLDPEYKAHKKWLKENQVRLFRFLKSP